MSRTVDKPPRCSTTTNIDFGSIENKIMMEEFEKKQLMKEIENYKKSIGQYRKSIAQTKKDIRQLDIQENKFMEINHLASNISQYTEQMTVANFNNYSRMVTQQEDTVKTLRKIKNKIKN